MGVTAAVLGASGYAGGELVRLLDGHPGIDPVYLGAHAAGGRRLDEVHPHLTGGERVLGSSELSDLPQTDLVFLALPHGASAALGSALASRGTLVVDLGSDFRLDTPERYRSAYDSEHPLPEELGSWAYGLPELFGDELRGAHRIAVPGCYPTAALLAAGPLVAAGLVTPEHLVVDALSGVTGAGRAVQQDLMFGEVGEGVRAYGVGGHRHRPEMEMALQRLAGAPVRLSFTPHLVPIQRGLLATVTAPLTTGADEAVIGTVLRDAYAASRFVEVIDRPPQTRWVVGSNRALVAAKVDHHAATVIVVAAIDNLLKGAAGQAVQCANLALGVDEGEGLPAAGLLP